MSENTPHTGGSPGDPGEKRSVVDMLDTLFSRSMTWEVGSHTELLPHVSALAGSAPKYGVEIIQLLNWATKDRIEITRPTLDAGNDPTLPTVVRDVEEALLYRINVEDLFGRPHTLRVDADQEISLPSLNYDVFTGSIALWGICGEGMVVDLERKRTTGSNYGLYVNEISEVAELEALTEGFDLDPSQFLDHGSDT